MKILLFTTLISIGIVFPYAIFSSPPKTLSLLTAAGDLNTEITTIINNMPGSGDDDFTEPSATELTTWNDLLQHLVDAAYIAAAADANTLDYSLTEFTHTPNGQIYYLLQNTATNYWGTYIFNPNYCRSTVIQSPHPKFDTNTGRQGIHVFLETDALFFCLAGTHRCNSDTDAPCSGTTGVCGASGSPYRISDLAHNDATIFQKTTDFLFSQFADSHFIQLHGFAMGTNDPFVILSNGSRTTPSPDLLMAFSNNLDAEDPILTFEIAHINTSWTRLIGFTNTQGRLINGSSNPCTIYLNDSDGRFFHVEQEFSRLRQDQIGWDKVANALSNTFVCTALPVELVSFTAHRISEAAVVCRWETASEYQVSNFEIQRSIDGKSWQTIATKEAVGFSEDQQQYSFLDKNSSFIDTYYQLKVNDLDGDFSYSTIIQIAGDSALKILKFFPNPANDFLYVEFAAEAAPTLFVFNALGQKVVVSTFQNQQQIALDLSNLPAGVYFLHEAEEGFVSKFIKKWN